MAGTDNILAGLEGLFGGISSVAVPVLTHRANASYDAELRRKQMEQELQQKISFLPYQTRAENEQAQFKAGLQPIEKIYNVNQETGEVNPNPIVGGSNENIKVNPVGGSKGMKGQDYISGLDILLGRPDLKGQIDPSKQYNKAMLPFLKPSSGNSPATQADAKTRVSGFLGGLKTLYDKLNEGGGIVNTEQSGLANLSAAASSSRAGQYLGKSLGTHNQSLRNQIVQTRPLLLQEIRKATQMGAKGLDSNAELELYLSAATNPNLDYQANINALSVLDKAYGLGLGLQKSNQSTNELFPNSSGGLTPDEEAELKQLESEIGGTQ